VTVETGAAIGNAGAPFIVENATNLRLDLQIPERLVGQIHPGMTISVAQDGRMAQGKVLAVAGSLDPLTRSAAAKASLPADSGFVPGKGVMATIAGAGQNGSVSVPSAAVTHVEGADEVFVRDGKGFRSVKVIVAGQMGDRSYLSSGIKPGAMVATSGVAELKSMQQGK
jgi:cobalt-zinc-cadmium efflux system membrane fusion protein